MSSVGAPFGGLFGGTKVLVTGHTGFKGSWLSRWLLDLGAEVWGLALEPDTSPALFSDLDLSRHMRHRIGDVRDVAAVHRCFSECKPQVVVHLAAQPLVRRSYQEPRYTFETNVLGTVNVLEAVRSTAETRAVVVITTDKVYDNPETGHPFAESEPLGGRDPYSASKAATEIAVASYRASFFSDESSAAVASARAGNVIGGGDWATDRIVPDCARALAAGQPVAVRNPESTRPWQHVLEPLSGYLHLATRLLVGDGADAEAWNFGPDPDATRSVREVVERFIAAWGEGSWTTTDLGSQPHEAGTLSLDVRKAQQRLAWRPVWGFDAAVDRTAEWYRSYARDPASAAAAVESDLAAYVGDAEAMHLAWTSPGGIPNA